MIPSKYFLSLNSDSKSAIKKKEKGVSKELKVKRKSKVNSLFIDRLSKIQRNLKYHKRTLYLVSKLDAAFKRNLNNIFEEQKDLDSLYENKGKVKLSLIKHTSNKEICLTKEQINLILAEKILKILQIEKNLEFIKESYLNKIDLNYYTKIRSSIINFLTEGMKAALFNIVLQSKTSDSVNLAASNAITLLNKSEFSFRNKDLSKISIPNADLSWGLFINTNFESSNLYGVDFSNSNLYDSNFRNCNMMNVNFGKILNFCIKNDTEIQCSPCGRVIWANLSFYNAITYKEIFLDLKKGSVSHLLLSDDGNYLAFIIREYTYLFDVSYNIPEIRNSTSCETPKLDIARFTNLIPCSFSPCSNYLCLSTNKAALNCSAKIYSIKERKIVNEIYLPYRSSITDANFSPLGEKLIASCGNTLSIWNLSRKTMIVMKRLKNCYRAVFSINRKYFIIYSGLKTILFRAENLEPIRFLASSSSWVVFSPCDRYLVLQTQNFLEIVDLWNLNKKLKITGYSFKGFSTQGKYALVSEDKNLMSWQLKLRARGNKHFLYISGAKEVSFSHDRNFFVVLTKNGTIFMFFTENQKLFKKFKAIQPCYKSVAVYESVVAAVNDNSIKIWNIYDEFLYKVINIDRNTQSIKFSDNGKKIAMFEFVSIDILDIDNDMIILRIKINSLSNIGWAWSHCGNFIFAMAKKNHGIIWCVDNQEVLIDYKTIEKDSLIRISQCENNLILIGKSKIITVWNLEDREQDRKEIRKIKELSSDYNIKKLMWSPDGKSIIAGDDRGNIIIWDYTSGKIIKKIAVQKFTVGYIDVSTRGSFIISGGGFLLKAAKMWKF